MTNEAASHRVNGWTLFAHPLFLEQLTQLITDVQALKFKNPAEYHQKNAAKRLAAIERLAFEIIPQDPSRADYRQGDTLGEAHRHWFRAKFFQQYRLFFRYNGQAKIIVYAWLNDEHTKRAYGSKSDAYAVFEKMLSNGHPPNDWDALLRETQAIALPAL
jgi:toxin YhaV